MKELKIIVIHANSPQAKGRIERLFGTFQDRLIKEMRLKKIKSKDEANEFLKIFLPKYNKMFAVSPTKEGDLHRKKLADNELDKILCIKTERKVRNDGVIRYNNRFYQLENTLRRREKVVILEDRLDGSLQIKSKDSYLKFKEIDPRLIMKTPVQKKQTNKPGRIYIPPKDHPWRKFNIKTYANHY